MKFLTLMCSGFGKEDAGFEFDAVTQELTVATGRLRGNFREVLSSVLFGKKKSEIEETEIPGVIELTFSDEDDEYVLSRSYEDRKENVSLTKNGEKIFKKDIIATVVELLGRNKTYLESLGFVTEEMSREFGKNGAEKYVALIGDAEERLSTCIEKNEEEKTATEARIANLQELTDGEQSVTRSQYAEIEKKIRDAENNNEELIAESGRINAFKASMEGLADKAARLLELEELSGDMRRLGESVALSRKAEAILADEAELERIYASRPVFEDKSEQLQDAEKRRDALKTEVENGRESLKKAESEVLYYADKLTEKRNEMLRIVDEVNEGGATALGEDIGVYYKSEGGAESDYAARLKDVEEEREALVLLIENIEEKRRELTYPAAYRKAVIDAARIEGRMEKQNVVISESKKRIEELEAEIAKKTKELEKLDKTSAELEKAGAELLAEIVGDHRSREEAVNDDAVIKNKLYSNHIIVKEQTAEIAAINDKIAKLEQNAAELADKREKLSAAKTEVEIHKAKLNHKLKLLGDKYNERIAENLYAKEIEALAYGDRCPVCDGFVVRKNAHPKIVRTDDILKDMDVLRKGIEEDDAKITRILLKLGAYMSAAESSAAYVKSLKDTADKKRELVGALLKECGATSAEELADALRKAIEQSKELNKNIDLYYDLEGRMASVLEAQERVRFQIKKASEVDLQRQRKIHDDAMADVAELVEEYKVNSEYLEEKRGTDLLPDILAVDKELETVDEDLDGARKRLAACDKEREEINNSFSSFNERLAKRTGGDAMAAAGIGAKAVAKKLNAAAKEIKQLEKQYEDAKARLVAVKTVTEDNAAELSETEIEIAHLSAGAEYKNVNDDLEIARADIKQRLKEFGLPDTAGLAAYVMTDDMKAEIENTMEEFNSELYMLRAAMKEAADPSFDADAAEEANEAARRMIRDEIRKLYVQQAEVGIKLSRQEKTARQIDEEERHLKVVKRNLKELRTIEGTVENGVINIGKLNEILLGEMSDAAFDMTKGACRLLKDEDRIAIVDEFGGGEVIAEDALTNYHRLVRQLAVSSVLSDTFDAVLDSDGSPFIILSGENVTAREAALIVECSKERRLTVVSDGSINRALLEVI